MFTRSNGSKSLVEACRSIVPALTLFGLLVLWVGPASAQDESGGFLQLFGGGFRSDGSCVLWEDEVCLQGLPEGGDTVFKGLRVGYRSADRWSVEVTIARDLLGESFAAPVQSRIDGPTGPGPSPIEPLDLRLWTVGGTYSLLRRDRLDLYASGAVGRITFDRNGTSDRSMQDLVTAAGAGALLHLWRIVFVRGDVRGYAQWCSEERFRRGFACEDGSVLGHLEATLGVQLVFHPYDVGAR